MSLKIFKIVDEKKHRMIPCKKSNDWLEGSGNIMCSYTSILTITVMLTSIAPMPSASPHRNLELII